MPRGRTFLLNPQNSITGAGSANQVAYFDGTNTVAGDSGLTYNPSTDILTVGGGISVTAGNLTLGTNSQINGTTAILLNGALADTNVIIGSDTNANHYVSDAGLFGGVGAHAFGTTANNGTVTTPALFSHPALTATANQPYSRVVIGNTVGAVTIPTGTASSVSSLTIQEPNITATGTVDDAYTFRVQSAPTEGTRNGAAWFAAGDVVVGTAALATNATSGFLHIPTCAGVPTGVPANGQAGTVAMVFDTTNNDLYVYDGGWIQVSP